MADLIGAHLARVKQSLLTGYSLENRGDWIVKNTILRREPFSFVGHEFQQKIVGCPAQEIVVRKCSQIGMSELQARDSLAMCAVMPGFTVIYTLPTAAFSKQFARTRVDPIIQSSPALRDRLNPNVDSGEVKQFGDSFIYFRGTKGMVAAISVPADCLVHDEYDFSDMDVLTSYNSRLTHSRFRMKRKFSTPTVPGWGISEEFDNSQQHWNMVKCNHCATWFLPDFERHVRVPGWEKELKDITKDNLHDTNFKHAELHCPACDAVPDLSPEHREWVVKDTQSKSDVVGFQIQPFDAPTFITMGYLVQQSTEYERRADFTNFMLGLPAEDSETSFSKEELEALFLFTGRFSPWANVMGIDMGLTCHFMVGSVGPDNRMDVIHCEQVPVGHMERRRDELRQKYRVLVTVMDSQPYFDMLIRMQAKDLNLWGAMFSNSKELDVYSTKIKEEDEEKGRPSMRVVDLNRNKALDVLLDYVRSGNLGILETPLKDLVIKHLGDMKRVRTITESNDLEYAWQKSVRKQDHFHHSLLYLYIASRLLSTVQIEIGAPNLFASFKLKVDV